METSTTQAHTRYSEYLTQRQQQAAVHAAHQAAQQAYARVHAEQQAIAARAQAAAWQAAVAAQSHADDYSPAASDPVGRTRKRKGNKPQLQQPYPPPHDYTGFHQPVLNQHGLEPVRAHAAAAAAYHHAAAFSARSRTLMAGTSLTSAAAAAAAPPPTGPFSLASMLPPRSPPLLTSTIGAAAPSYSYASAVAGLHGSNSGGANASRSVLPMATPVFAHERGVLTLGIETADDSMCTVIARGTPLPCSVTQLFSTYADHQPGVSILVYQGQRASTQQNQFLGRLDLLGIRSAPRGVPHIEVTFALDVFGLLKVTANESLHGSVQPLVVESHFEAPVKYWQADEVQRILKDAELHRTEDALLVARTAAKLRLEQYVYGLRTSLEQHAWHSRLSIEEAALIQRQHEACVHWLSAHEEHQFQCHGRSVLRPEDFQRKLDDMQRICQPIILKMYEANASDHSHPSAPSSSLPSPPSSIRMADVSAAAAPCPPATATTTTTELSTSHGLFVDSRRATPPLSSALSIQQQQQLEHLQQLQQLQQLKQQLQRQKQQQQQLIQRQQQQSRQQQPLATQTALLQSTSPSLQSHHLQQWSSSSSETARVRRTASLPIPSPAPPTPLHLISPAPPAVVASYVSTRSAMMSSMAPATAITSPNMSSAVAAASAAAASAAAIAAASAAAAAATTAMSTMTLGAVASATVSSSPSRSLPVVGSGGSGGVVFASPSPPLPAPAPTPPATSPKIITAANLGSHHHWPQAAMGDMASLQPQSISGSPDPRSSLSSLAPFPATSSPPLISSMAPHQSSWTHPSLLTSPILASSNYHASTDFPLTSSTAGSNGQDGGSGSSNGNGARRGSPVGSISVANGNSHGPTRGPTPSPTSSPTATQRQSSDSGSSSLLMPPPPLPPPPAPPPSMLMEEAYNVMDFRFFPDSATVIVAGSAGSAGGSGNNGGVSSGHGMFGDALNATRAAAAPSRALSATSISSSFYRPYSAPPSHSHPSSSYHQSAPASMSHSRGMMGYSDLRLRGAGLLQSSYAVSTSSVGGGGFGGHNNNNNNNNNDDHDDDDGGGDGSPHEHEEGGAGAAGRDKHNYRTPS